MTDEGTHAALDKRAYPIGLPPMRRPEKEGGDSVPDYIGQRAVPKYSSNAIAQSGNIAGVGQFPSVIDDSHYEYIATRMIHGSRTLAKIANDCFDKWFTIEADSQALADEIAALNERLDVQGTFKIVFTFAQVWGYGLISLGWDEMIDEVVNLEAAPIENSIGIGYISAINKKNVEKINEDLDPTSPTYGNVESYEIRRPAGSGSEKVTINGERILHWERPNIYNTRDGESFFKAMYNAMLGFENMTYAIPEALWQNIAPLRHLELPEWMDKLTPAQQTELYDDAVAFFTDLNVKESLVTYDGYKIHTQNTNNGMDVKEPVDFLENLIGAGGVNRYLLEGYPAGKITGSEINRDEYYNDIGNIQQFTIEKKLREFYGCMQRFGILPEGDYEIVWNPTKVLSEIEQAELANIKASTLQKIASAVNLLTQAGKVVKFDEDSTFTVSDGTGGEIAGLLPAVETTGMDKRGLDKFTQREYQEARKSAVWPSSYDGPFFNGTKQSFIAAEEAWREELEKMVRATLTGTDDQADLLQRINDYAYSFAEFEEFMLSEYPDTYEASGVEAARILQVGGQASASFDPRDKAAQKWLREQANIQFNKTATEMNDKIKQGLSQILEKGLRISTQKEVNNLLRSLDNSVVEAFSKYDGNLRTMARTETQRIVSSSTLENYAQNGIEQAEIVVDPTACSQCQAYAGDIMPLEEAQGLIPIHPNCTCLWIPVLPDQTTSSPITQTLVS